MPHEIWHKVLKDDIAQSVTNPQVIRLLQDWDRMRHGRLRPRLADGRPSRWPALVDQLMLLRREPGGGWIYHHFGAEIVRHAQVDLSGQRVADIDGALREFLAASYREALAGNRPIYTVHFSDCTPAVATWERLVLPLEDEHGNDWMLVYVSPLEMRHELLETVLNATSDALLALRQLHDLSGQGIGWLCLVANPRFTELFEVCAHGLTGRMVHQVVPDWARLDIEAECLQTLQSSTGRSITRVLAARGGRPRYLQIQIGPLRDGVVLSIADTTALHEAQSRLRHLATTDALTGLDNRREFDESLRREARRARRSGEALTLVMADIDAFKAYNDRYGHAAGDDCLRQFAQLLRSVFAREPDRVARYGGEEFAVLLPGTDVEAALRLTERLLVLLRQQALPHLASAVASHVTASFGVAGFDRRCDDDELGLLRRADSALYRAKQDGRNRACAED